MIAEIMKMKYAISKVPLHTKIMFSISFGESIIYPRKCFTYEPYAKSEEQQHQLQRQPIM
jgi:hypothetical protein